LDHYFFNDPIYGTNFTYSNSADGGVLNNTNTWASTADDGGFANWQYGIQNNVYNAGIGPLKGPYTVYFSPTGLDTSVYSILQIAYDFGDGETLVVNRTIEQLNFTQGSNASLSEPNGNIISHDYYPQSSSGITVYTPSITAVYSNLVYNVYNFTLSSAPTSIYELNDIHLISNTQQLLGVETQNIFEVEQPNYLTVARLLSTVDNNYITSTPFLPTSINGLVLWLDASDATTIYKATQLPNTLAFPVVRWKDKSGLSNDFTAISSQPIFKYNGSAANRSGTGVNNIASTGRKSVAFSGSQSLINTTLSSTSLSGNGYTAIFVTGVNSISSNLVQPGPIITHNTGSTSDTNISFLSSYTLNISQGAGSTSISNISQNLSSYSLYSVTISGASNTYITADTLIAQNNKGTYTYSTSSAPYYIGYSASTNTYLQNSEISEIILYNRPLLPADITSLQTYLVNKWGLTLKKN
jgi:hypothetical protein